MVCLVVRLWPIICDTSSGTAVRLTTTTTTTATTTARLTLLQYKSTYSFVTFTPPWSPLEKTPFPRPPANICAFTTTSSTPANRLANHRGKLVKHNRTHFLLVGGATCLTNPVRRWLSELLAWSWLSRTSACCSRTAPSTACSDTRASSGDARAPRRQRTPARV